MAASAKTLYEKPQVETERIFETLGAGHTFVNAADDKLRSRSWRRAAQRRPLDVLAFAPRMIR